MEEGGGSRTVCDADASGVHIEDVGCSSELSMSTASDATIKEPKTTDAERRKERKAAKIATREAREKKKEEQRLKDKKKRKEGRRITREARAKRRAARAQEKE